MCYIISNCFDKIIKEQGDLDDAREITWSHLRAICPPLGQNLSRVRHKALVNKNVTDMSELASD